MQISHEGELRLSQLRAKVAAGAELSIEEMREVVRIISEGRRNAAVSSDAARRRAASTVTRSAEELLKGLLP